MTNAAPSLDVTSLDRGPVGIVRNRRDKHGVTLSIGPGGRVSLYWPEDLYAAAGYREGTKVKARAEGDRVIMYPGNQAAPQKTMGQVLITRLPVGGGGRKSTRLQAKFSGLLPNIREIAAAPVADVYLNEAGEVVFVMPAHTAAAKKLKANEDDMRALENALSLVNRAISKGIAKADLDDGRVVLSVTTVRQIGRD